MGLTLRRELSLAVKNLPARVGDARDVGLTLHWELSLVVKNLPARVGDARDVGLTLRWEDPLEEDMAVHSSILAWTILWTEEPGGL